MLVCITKVRGGGALIRFRVLSAFGRAAIQPGCHYVQLKEGRPFALRLSLKIFSSMSIDAIVISTGMIVVQVARTTRYARHTIATQSISISNGPVHSGTQTKMRRRAVGKMPRVDRVDGGEVSWRGAVMLHFMTSPSEAPAAARQSFL